jgi:hypothetical protein
MEARELGADGRRQEAGAGRVFSIRHFPFLICHRPILFRAGSCYFVDRSSSLSKQAIHENNTNHHEMRSESDQMRNEK